MPEKFSPEIKNTPDGTKNSSNLSSAGKPPLDKAEANPNIYQHPAEIFPWLPKEEYFQRRDQYVPRWIPIGIDALRQNPQFSFREDPGITRTTMELFSRGLFVADYLKERYQYDRSIPIIVRAGTHFISSDIGGETWPFFYLRDKYIHNYFDVDQKDIGDLKLTETQIYMNINKLGSDIKEAKEFAKQRRQQGEPKQHVDAWQDAYIESLGITQELSMVEEMAHAFYLIREAQNPESLTRLLREAKSYPRPDPTLNRPRTPEELQVALSSPIEQDAVKWVEIFTQRYYAYINAKG